jgi:predicted GIY-YIG superfamily endonuclease
MNRPFDAIEAIANPWVEPVTFNKIMEDTDSMQFHNLDSYTNPWVYFLVNWIQIVYIWYSTLPLYRVMQHKAQWRKKFDRFIIKHYDSKEKAINTETALIKELVTVYNKEVISDFQYKTANDLLLPSIT